MDQLSGFGTFQKIVDLLARSDENNEYLLFFLNWEVDEAIFAVRRSYPFTSQALVSFERLSE